MCKTKHETCNLVRHKNNPLAGKTHFILLRSMTPDWKINSSDLLFVQSGSRVMEVSNVGSCSAYSYSINDWFSLKHGMYSFYEKTLWEVQLFNTNSNTKNILVTFIIITPNALQWTQFSETSSIWFNHLPKSILLA